MLKSKKQGDEAEDELIEHLKTVVGLSAEKNLVHSLRFDHDVRAYNDTIEYTFEVKNDVMATKTGNIAIEYHNSRKDAPSGISATKALFWCHKVNGILWIVSVAKLKEFVETATPFKTIKNGGDKNANLYIYKIDAFTAICKPLGDLISLDDFKSLLL